MSRCANCAWPGRRRRRRATSRRCRAWVPVHRQAGGGCSAASVRALRDPDPLREAPPCARGARHRRGLARCCGGARAGIRDACGAAAQLRYRDVPAVNARTSCTSRPVHALAPRHRRRGWRIAKFEAALKEDPTTRGLGGAREGHLRRRGIRQQIHVAEAKEQARAARAARHRARPDERDGAIAALADPPDGPRQGFRQARNASSTRARSSTRGVARSGTTWNVAATRGTSRRRWRTCAARARSSRRACSTRLITACCCMKRGDTRRP